MAVEMLYEADVKVAALDGRRLLLLVMDHKDMIMPKT